MRDVLAFLLAWLIVYRLSTDLAEETGPGGLYSALRGWAMVRTPDWMAEGVTCPICWSWWLALPAGIAISPNALFVVYWVAIAGAVALAVRIADSQQSKR